MSNLVENNNLLKISDEEIQAQEFIKNGEVDQALAIYQQLKPGSARIFNIIGVLYLVQKGDYDSAVKYFNEALQIQETNGEDISNTLTELGITYQHLHEFDMALACHFRALNIRKLAYCVDVKLVASSLIGIANAYWGQQNLSEALHYAQEALTLNESIISGNDLNMVTNLAVLANIYHNAGNYVQALELITRAVMLFESCAPADSLVLASLLNNLGTIQVGVGLFTDAQLNYIRVLKIYEKSLPEEHPKRVAIKNNIQRIVEMERFDSTSNKEEKSFCRPSPIIDTIDKPKFDVGYSSASNDDVHTYSDSSTSLHSLELSNDISLPIISDEEIQAQNLVENNEVDQALTIYQQLKPQSARVFSIIGVLYADKKGDYDSAVKYFKEALQIQEKNGEDTSDTLTKLGIAYQNLHKFDMALACHFRALNIRKLAYCVDLKLVAHSLIEIANAYWGQQNLSEALHYAEEALTLNESIESGNDSNLAANLAILANIHHNFGDDIRALKLATRALSLLERCVPPNSPVLAPLLNNIGVIQISVGLFVDAKLTFIRVLNICEKTLPEGHPKRVTMENNIQRITEMEEYNDPDLYSYLWKFLSKILL